MKDLVVLYCVILFYSLTFVFWQLDEPRIKQTALTEPWEIRTYPRWTIRDVGNVLYYYTHIGSNTYLIFASSDFLMNEIQYMKISAPMERGLIKYNVRGKEDFDRVLESFEIIAMEDIL
jgi:hypothetical protein